MASLSPAELSTEGGPLIKLDEEIDGDEVGSKNYRFAKIGEPIPIKSGSTIEFDPHCLPPCPLAISERFRLLFVAHHHGFFVTRTNDILVAAEEFKEKQTGPSVQELSLIDVTIGKLLILSLSADDSLLAACMDNSIHFFAVSALLHKDQIPSYSVSIDDSICIRDFCWVNSVAKIYIVLAASGKLYSGSGQGPLNYVMEDVDAVDFYDKGNLFAVAKKNRISVLSSKFKEKISFLLQFQSVTVDSIQWIRSDCLAVGCFQINEDGEEENYVVQVITNMGRQITEGSSKPIVLSFNNVFIDFCLDAVPARSGSHLFLSYLDHCGLAFIANRNLSRQVGLLCWSVNDGKNEVAMVEILNDAWNLYIDSQGNGEENVIVGLSVDKVSQNENVTFTLGDEEKEVSPCCIVICLTIDGKISVFHFVSAAGAFPLPEGCTFDEENFDRQTSTEHEITQISSSDKEKSRELASSNERLVSLPCDIVDTSDRYSLQSAGAGLRYPIDEKEKAKPYATPSSFGHALPTREGSRHAFPVHPISHVPLGLSVVSGNSMQSDFKKGVKTSSATGVPYSAQSTVKQFGNVEEMTTELDSLLKDIEGEGGFRDASIKAQTQCFTGLENDICALSQKCRTWRVLMDKQLSEIQLLLDKTVQVLVRKVYMEGIFKQASDSRYWELWNRQKLSSELELKQRRILQLNQELTNKLIELERHFNSLEFRKYGESAVQGNSRPLQNWQGPARKIQSLYSLRNTIQAQLVAAEQLSGCLSEQMQALSIGSFGKQDIKKQLFDSIGLSYVGNTPISLAKENRYGTPSKTEHCITSSSFGSKEKPGRIQASFGKNEEPETARRHRESLDRSWAYCDPPKTTVKRILKEKLENKSASSSFPTIDEPNIGSQVQNKSEVAHSEISNLLSVNQYKTKGTTELPAGQSAYNSSMSLYQKTARWVDPGLQVSSTSPKPLILEASTGNSEQEGAMKLNDEKPNNTLGVTGKKDALVASSSKFVQKSDTSFHSLPSMPKRLPDHLMTLPSDPTDNDGRFKIEFTKSTNIDQKSHSDASGTFSSERGSFTGLNVSERGSFTGNAEISSRSDDGLAASTPLKLVGPSLLSSNNSLSVSSHLAKPSSFTVFPVTSSSADGNTVTQEAPQPHTSLLSFPSLLPSSTHEGNLSSISPSCIVKSESPLASLSHPPAMMSGSKLDDTSRAQTSAVSMPLKPVEDNKIQGSASHFVPAVSVTDLKAGVPLLSVPAEISDNSKPENQIDLSVSSMIVSSVAKIEMHQTSEVVPPIAQSTEKVVGSMNVVSDVSNEEKMEEEAPEMHQITEFAVKNPDGFGIGTTSNSTIPKSNPFGVDIVRNDTSFAALPYTVPASGSDLFRPASFNFQSPQPLQPLQPTASFSGAFSSGSPGQVSGTAAFGQSAHIGAGQQALGSVLGTFGQSRQLGTGLTGSNVASASGFGSGVMGVSAAAFGGFMSAASSGGFASLASGAGGFAAAATGGGGFAAAAATVGGGFAAAATAGGGFTSSSIASAITGGGGGGFGAFGGLQQSSGGGFSAFSSSGPGALRPTSQLFTQMRK